MSLQRSNATKQKRTPSSKGSTETGDPNQSGSSTTYRGHTPQSPFEKSLIQAIVGVPHPALTVGFEKEVCGSYFTSAKNGHIPIAASQMSLQTMLRGDRLENMQKIFDETGTDFHKHYALGSALQSNLNNTIRDATILSHATRIEGEKADNDDRKSECQAAVKEYEDKYENWASNALTHTKHDEAWMERHRDRTIKLGQSLWGMTNVLKGFRREFGKGGAGGSLDYPTSEPESAPPATMDPPAQQLQVVPSWVSGYDTPGISPLGTAVGTADDGSSVSPVGNGRFDL